MTERQTTAPPVYRSRPLARREHFSGALVTVREVPGGLEVTHAMSGTRLWIDRGGGWFEEQSQPVTTADSRKSD